MVSFWIPIGMLLLAKLSITYAALGDDQLKVLELSRCPVSVEPIGCYKDKGGFTERALPRQILNSRDLQSDNYMAPQIQWGNYNHWMANFICECAKRLLKEKPGVKTDYIGLQFYGECWANLEKSKPSEYDRYGKTSTCITSEYKGISAEEPTSCGMFMGGAKTNYVYKVTKYYRSCPEMEGKYTSKYGEVDIKIYDFEISGDWHGNRADFSGELADGCKGSIAFPDDRKYSFEYDTETCVLKLTRGYTLTKTNCNSSIPCPHFKSRGCWKDGLPRAKPDQRPMPIYAMNERDPYATNWNGRFIQWWKWGEGYLANLLCRCAKMAKKENKKFFSIQFYGECWFGDDERFNRDGAVTSCVDDKWNVCPLTDKSCRTKLCAGEWETNKVYEIQQGPQECSSNPCQNDGRCVTNGPNNYECICKSGTHGKNCQNKH